MMDAPKVEPELPVSTEAAPVKKAKQREPLVIEIAGLPPVTFLGWRSTHTFIHVAALGKAVSRSVIFAGATLEGRGDGSGCAVLRPGDRFDRETGKRLALARLVKALVPDCIGGVREPKQKVLRSKLFREIWTRTHGGALPKKPGHTYTIDSSLIDSLRLHQLRNDLWMPLAPGESRGWIAPATEEK